MPWIESTKVEEKLKFVARYVDGEIISDLCREFGIYRVAGHKVIARYRESGLEALTDLSRRPVRFANQLPFQVEQQIVKITQQWPSWGAPKTRDRLFREFGLPDAIRSDNGVPFSSPYAIHGLSKLSAYWLRLGIAIERIKPGNSQQNGRHERMHRTLKKYCTRPAGMNILQQQEMFERFIDEYNNERPHQALDLRRA